MPRTLSALALIALLSPLALAQAPVAAEYVQGDVIVCPAAGRGGALRPRLEAQGLQVTDTDAVSGALLLRVPAGQEATWIAHLSADRDVAYAERNGIGHGGLVPNDTHFTGQWHLRNTGQSGGTAGADIRATDAWNVTTGSPNIVIAVLDTGIDSDHPEFAGRIDPDGYDFVNNDSDPEGDHAHGSWVAGVMAANANNGFGVAGVDWHCFVLPIKVLDANNAGTTFNLAQGLNYCATQTDVRVISMSLINYPGNATLINALQTARNAGKILIACAGNGGIGNANVSYPGASPLTISIGATTASDTRASFSGTGSALDFVAPGSNVVTLAFDTSANTTAVVSGCSFATPITSGIVGLMLARAEALNFPPLTQQQVYDTLRLGAKDQVGPPGEDTPGRDDFFGHGRLDAASVVDAVPLLYDCGNGNVGVGLGGPYDVARVNGLAQIGRSRTVPVPANLAAVLAVEVPPSLPLPGPVPAFFLLWATLGDTSNTPPFTLPLGIGEMCFDPTSPATLVAFAGIAPWSTPTPPLPVGFVASLQGVILDDPLAHIAVTNRVTFEAQPFPPPTITTVAPLAAAAGQSVTITGTGFLPGITLQIGGNPIAVSNVTATQVQFVVPGVMQCDTSLTLTNPDSQSATATFNVSPVITSYLAPGGTPAAGGPTVLLIGQNFVAGSTVTIGGSPMTIASITSTVIIGALPPGNVGPATILVTTPSGCTASGLLTYM
ncbi:MAG TPA: S8 family serine peptidase [Planctomycetota bacterium]|nr:S8 family serine peptidase [Planctomycetota bacterium]